MSFINIFVVASAIIIAYIIIVGLLGPGVDYLLVSWACDPSREQRSVWGWEVYVRGNNIDK